MQNKKSVFLFSFLIASIVLGVFLLIFSRQKIMMADFQSTIPEEEASTWREFGGKLTIGQTFKSPSKKLAKIRVFISNPQKAPSDTHIILYVKKHWEDANCLTKSSQTLEALQEEKYIDFIIDPELSLTNQKLYFYLEAPNLPKEKYLQARTESEARSYPEGNLYWNHKEKSADLIFALYHQEKKLQYYLGRFWQKNIRRIPQGGRGIIWLAAIIVLFYALIKILFVAKIQKTSGIS